MITSFLLIAALACNCKLVTGQTSSAAGSLPTVDLGYAIYRASQANTPGDSATYYNFSNIRYAAPPLGQLRFSAPATPVNNRSVGVQDGSYGKICFQGPSPGQSSSSSTSSPLESEDCLFLDVIVSSDVFKSGGAPVLVWIYGGAFTIGSKTIDGGNPAGLLKRSRENNSNGVIYVAMNYRLGAFGFLAGSTLQANGSANAGILDQRAALNWIQQYIHLFGGDPNKVTVFGESAGGSSILHHITAYGGKTTGGSTPFQAAIMQSPAFFPLTSTSDYNSLYNAYLNAAGVSSLSALRQLSSDTLQKANKAVINQATPGTFGWGPTIDGSYVPDLPGILLSQGSFNRSIKVIVARNGDEGTIFNPNVTTDAQFNSYLAHYLPHASSSVLNYVNTTMYPAVYDGSQNYTTPFDRFSLFFAEFIIICNPRYVVKSFSSAYEYIFTVPPAYHGSDVPYTYFSTSNSQVKNETLAQIMQRYITNFAKTGTPNAVGAPQFPSYGNGILQNLNLTFISQIKDPEANSRCDWWQKASYK